MVDESIESRAARPNLGLSIQIGVERGVTRVIWAVWQIVPDAPTVSGRGHLSNQRSKHSRGAGVDDGDGDRIDRPQANRSDQAQRLIGPVRSFSTLRRPCRAAASQVGGTTGGRQAVKREHGR